MRARKSDGRRRHVIISIRWIISGAVILLTTMSVLGVGGLGERQARRALNREIATRLMLEARNLALLGSRAMLSEFPELTLQPILRLMHSGQPQLVFAAVIDQHGDILGHSDAKLLGTTMTWPPNLTPSNILVSHGPGERLLSNGEILVAQSPVRHTSGEWIGVAVVAFEKQYVESVIREARHQQFVLMAVLLGVCVILATLAMSLVLRPIGRLREGLERIGRGDLETPVELNDGTELGLLAGTMNDMAKRIRSAQDELVKKEHLAREMAIAREIQESLLPTQETRTHGFVIAGAQRAAAEVGGDYYDIFPVPDGRIGIVIADVSGKGLAGCMVTSMLAVLIRAFRSTELDPSRMLVRVQGGLWESIRRNTFVTMFYGLIDPRSGRLTCASAGHSPALIYRAARGETEWLRSPGIPIGAIGGDVLEETLANSIVDLEPGDVLVQYTDGINEAFDPRRRQFGFGRLERVVRSAARSGCRHLLDTVQDVIREWRHADVPTDDETLLVVSRELGAVDPSPAQPPAAASRAFALEPAVGGRDASSIAEIAVEQVSDRAAQETAIEFLARARKGGCRLAIDARFDALPGVRNWLVGCPGYDRLSASQAILVELALWEVCANIIEHGYHEDSGQRFHLWAMTEPPVAEIGDNGPIDVMRFVVLDHGVSFRPHGRMPVDFTDPSVRRRGRGLGLEIIHAVMRHVRYQPGTPEGNITILEFDPTARLENISNVG